MRSTRPQNRLRPVPVIGKFIFTDRELGTIQKGILVSTRAMAYQRWGALGYRQYGWDARVQRNNQRASGKAVRAVRTGIASGVFRAPVLAQVYTSAYTAYENARLLKCDEVTARRDAVVVAQMELEFVMGVYEYATGCGSCGFSGRGSQA